MSFWEIWEQLSAAGVTLLLFGAVLATNAGKLSRFLGIKIGEKAGAGTGEAISGKAVLLIRVFGLLMVAAGILILWQIIPGL